ncbi:MAG: aminodeoxychorismate synthase component I [Thermoflexales bacterium]|nr:aminodeoxychorismate synthase component I [Thermoflexales bacterium]
MTTTSLADVISRLRRVEELVQTNAWFAAGFLAYEAAPAFDVAHRVKPATAPNVPLLWFGLYESVEPFEPPDDFDRAAYSIGPWLPTVTWPEYERAIDTIKQHIADGETYQVNYTYRLRAPFQGDAWPLFLSLARKQPVGYAAYVDLGTHVVCSASPELFFQLSGRTLMSKPMKGTAARGRTLTEDQAQAEWLLHSEKNRAENVMIVDMIRNDVGRIAEVGSVTVPQLFEVERYPTVLQMTSTVQAQTDKSLTDIMTALFPCASITGAPKVRTMQLIAELETTPRGVYTGCIGYLTPQREAQFNVAIRTVTIDRATGQAEYGVGGGIVWDSDAADEFRECEIKTRVLTQPARRFDVIEAMLWTPDEAYFLLERHLARLAESAAYFNIPIDLHAIQNQLADFGATLTLVAHKVRVSVTQRGRVSLTAVPLSEIPLPPVMRVALAAQPIDSSNVFLYHKTTRRDVYDAARAARPDCDDVVLWNERGEITESTIANVVVELNGQRYTPPVECGLLPGTFRADLIARGLIHERVILKEELRAASRVWLINSVRGWLDVQLTMTNEQ